MLLYQKANPAHYKQKPRKKIHMRIMTSVWNKRQKLHNKINLLNQNLEQSRV